MRKIKVTHSNKDRIIFVNALDRLIFYYQPTGTHDREYLFETPSSPSVKDYFYNKGRWISKGCWKSKEQEETKEQKKTKDTLYITVGELYRFRDYHNAKLTNILERIPLWIEYAVKDKNGKYNYKQYDTMHYFEQNIYDDRDDERAA